MCGFHDEFHVQGPGLHPGQARTRDEAAAVRCVLTLHLPRPLLQGQGAQGDAPQPRGPRRLTALLRRITSAFLTFPLLSTINYALE